YASALLSHAVNYAAEIDPGDNGVSYAVKGVFGFYGGYFSVLPYYEKVKQYSAMEQRDVWEYRLNLDAAEVRRLTLHAWELRGMVSDYFFFDENCSYNLLFLLEAARPGVHLSDGYGPWVTPLATVERILAAGLVEARTYRPSQATTLRHNAGLLGRGGVELARQVVRGEVAPGAVAETGLSPVDRARVLDIAATFQQARLSAGEVGEAQYQEHYLEILRARSRLPPSAAGADAVPEPAAPETGHSSSRAYLTGGSRSGDVLLEVGFRPAYHELLDPDRGFLPGSQIHFFEGVLRSYPATGRLHLQRFDLVDIVSLSPRDRFFEPVSFAVRGGLRTKPFGPGDDGLVGALAGGGGLAWGGADSLWYGLAEGEADVSGRYAGGVAVGLGGRGGVLANLTQSWKVQLEGRAVPYLLGAHQPDLSVRLGQSLRLARNHSLFLDLERAASSGVLLTEITLRWNLYF
ncbi:MAG TPA: DUF4105 domain-containing protein, partial [Deferrisomatales bacterium]|nr:DUF4105 domain-containing protein [Deferrisomatales bacterium]